MKRALVLTSRPPVEDRPDPLAKYETLEFKPSEAVGEMILKLVYTTGAGPERLVFSIWETLKGFMGEEGALCRGGEGVVELVRW